MFKKIVNLRKEGNDFLNYMLKLNHINRIKKSINYNIRLTKMLIENNEEGRNKNICKI